MKGYAPDTAESDHPGVATTRRPRVRYLAMRLQSAGRYLQAGRTTACQYCQTMRLKVTEQHLSVPIADPAETDPVCQHETREVQSGPRR